MILLARNFIFRSTAKVVVAMVQLQITNSGISSGLLVRLTSSWHLLACRDAAVKRREERKRKREATEKAAEPKKAKTEEGLVKEEVAAAATGEQAAAPAATTTAAPAAPVAAAAEEAMPAPPPPAPVAEADVKRVRVLSNSTLALAFRFLDRTGAGYIK